MGNIYRVCSATEGRANTKDEVPGLLLKAIHSIYSEKDKAWISPEVIKKTGAPFPITSQALSIREVEILDQLVLDQPESDDRRRARNK